MVCAQKESPQLTLLRSVAKAAGTQKPLCRHCGWLWGSELVFSSVRGSATSYTRGPHVVRPQREHDKCHSCHRLCGMERLPPLVPPFSHDFTISRENLCLKLTR